MATAREELEAHISNLNGLIDGDETDGLGSQLVEVRDFLVKLRDGVAFVGNEHHINAWISRTPKPSKAIQMLDFSK